MSAQIITALRNRARGLDVEADTIESLGASELQGSPGRSVAALRMMAAEFRALADAAEAR